MNFIIALHNHQPVGNFGEVFEEAYAKSYHPFLISLEKFPDIKVSLHYSGILLEWLREYRKEFFTLLKKLIDRGQVEMLGGGFYEPILCALPKRDQIAQIKKLSSYVNNHFGVTPQGLWLTERVWEQSLVSSIVEAGIDFTMVDDTHFFYSGVEEKNMRGYFLTEDEGNILKIFPMSKQMRYAIPFHTIEKLADELKRINGEKAGSKILLYGDDGEKFGVWPKTYEHVFEKLWLEDFLRLLQNNTAWLNVKSFDETIKEIAPLGTMYLQSASYSEMLHWALPAKAFVEYEDFEKKLEKKKNLIDYGTFVRGGYWKNFFVKYSEINWLHKRMTDVSRQIASAKSNNIDVSQAEEHLYTSQCNDVYWHGVFGGVYLPWLRRPVFQNLIEAEKCLSGNRSGYTVSDIDIDGKDEIHIFNAQWSIFLKPSFGGEIAEIDFKSIAHNLSDVVMRRSEGYHRKVLEAKKVNENDVATIHDVVKAKEDGLEKYLVEDTFRRLSLIDHFFDIQTTLHDFRQQNWKQISNYAGQEYTSTVKEGEQHIHIALHRSGDITYRKKINAVRIEKTIEIPKSGAEMKIHYTFRGEEKIPNVFFGSEWNLTLSAGDADDRYFLLNNEKPEQFHLRSTGESEQISSLKMIDEWLNIEIEFTFQHPVRLWRYPVETVSLSEDGFERVYQGSCLLPLWNVGGKKEFKTSFIFSVRKFA